MNGKERFLKAAAGRSFAPAVQQFPAGTRSAGDAANAIGCEVGQIVKSLVFMADGDPVMVLASGAHRVNEQALAEALGATELTKADASQVRSATGYAIGGTPPLGHASELPTLLDSHLLGYDVVWAAAGTPDTCFPITPSELHSMTGAEILEIGDPMERPEPAPSPGTPTSFDESIDGQNGE